jgi:sugar phosphate isomerase/epimerase
MMKYSATTVALPELTMLEQARLLQGLGFDGVELRVRRVADEQRAMPPSIWGNHRNDITPENFRQQAGSIVKILGDHGLALAGIASGVTCLDLEQVKLLLDGAVATRAPFIRVGASAGYNGTRPYREIHEETIAGYSRVIDLAKGTGVRILLEIHGGTIHPSASLALRIVGMFDPAHTGVIFDPQNMVSDGFETTGIAMEILGAYIAHCHVGGHRPEPGVADANGTVPWTWPGCRMAEGLYHHPALLAGLKKIGFQGFISVEDFRSAPVEEKLADALRYLKSIEAGLK